MWNINTNSLIKTNITYLFSIFNLQRLSTWRVSIAWVIPFLSCYKQKETKFQDSIQCVFEKWILLITISGSHNGAHHYNFSYSRITWCLKLNPNRFWGSHSWSLNFLKKRLKHHYIVLIWEIHSYIKNNKSFQHNICI